MTRFTLPLFFAAMACTGTITDGMSGPTDAATDVTDGTDTGGPTDATPVEPADVSFDIAGDFAGMALSIQRVGAPSASDFRDFDFREILTSSAVTSATPSIVLEPVPDADLDEVASAPAVRWAVYHVALHMDDGNTTPDAGEVYTAVAETNLVFINSDEVLPASLAALGIQKGWNAISLLGTTSFDGVGSLSDIPIEVHEPSDTITLSGIVEPFVYKPYGKGKGTPTGDTGGTGTGDTGGYGYDFGDSRLALNPGGTAALATGSDITLMVDEAFSDDDTWSMSLSGAPPADHATVADALPGGSVFEFPMSYFDVDDSASFDAGDFFDAPACDEAGESVRLFWVVPSDDRGFAAAMKGRTGWVASLQEIVFDYGKKGKYGKKGTYGNKGTKGTYGKYKPFDYELFDGISPADTVKTGSLTDLTISYDCLGFGYY